MDEDQDWIDECFPVLAKFFLSELGDDPAGVADWLKVIVKLNVEQVDDFINGIREYMEGYDG